MIFYINSSILVLIILNMIGIQMLDCKESFNLFISNHHTLPIIGICVGHSIIPYIIHKLMSSKYVKGFKKVKDIIRGTITAEIEELKDAYLHFKATPGVKIFAIKEKMDLL